MPRPFKRVSPSLRRCSAPTSSGCSDLTAALAQAKPDQKDKIQDQLDLAQSQLELDKDELDEANQNLVEAGGNPRQQIESMVKEHEAQTKAQSEFAGPESARRRSTRFNRQISRLVAAPAERTGIWKRRETRAIERRKPLAPGIRRWRAVSMRPRGAFRNSPATRRPRRMARRHRRPTPHSCSAATKMPRRWLNAPRRLPPIRRY